MATLTTNISNVSLTVSGKNTQTVTISWTCPTVPAGSTITSCTLTGRATASMNKGNATIKVNGTTVSSGSNFTINLGTANTTSSVSATAVGGNKNASGTVTFSNLVYTVNYTEPLPTYTVTFKDWNGSVLKTQTVESGNAATAPSNPSREGYDFTGWDKSFSNITSDLTVTAQYSIKTYEVRFYEDEIYVGSYINVLKTEIVEYGKSATAPEAPVKEGYIFIGWSNSFTNITSDLDIYALYEVGINDTLQIKEDGNWINISKVYKRISGNWVEQINSDWHDLFNPDLYYVKAAIPIAILYSDGTLVFQDNNIADSSYGDIVDIFEVKNGYGGYTYTAYRKAPWIKNYANEITNVVFNMIISSSKYFSYWFSGCPIISIDFKNINMRNAISMENMFYFCEELTSLDLKSLNTSNVTNMYCMFHECSKLTSLDLSNFDTSNVTDINSMFRGCSSLTSLDLSNFDTSNVTNMSSIFNGCSSLTSIDISNFDTSNVTNMGGMFSNCSSLTSIDISNFDTSNVTNMNSMFTYCSNLTSLDVSNFDTGNVTNMSNMFNGCSTLTSLDLSSFDMTNVTSTNSMFQNCTSLQTIYVKDETAKTKIEASEGFPTGVSVIIGKPN